MFGPPVGRHPGCHPLAEGARAVVEVPVERLGQRQALRGFQPQRVHVADEHQHCRQRDLAAAQAELARLLDAVDGVPPGIAERHHLRAGGFRLQQEGGEIGGRRERIRHTADHLPAGALDERRCIALQGVAEGVVGGDEEPGLAPRLDQCAAVGARQHVGVERPVHRGRRAALAGQVGGARAGDQEHLVLLPRNLRDREADGAVRHIDDRVHASLVEPCARDAGADIGLVLMVGLQHLDRQPRKSGRRLRRRLLRAGDRAGAGGVAIRTGQIGQHAEANGPRCGGAGADGNRGGGKRAAQQRAAVDRHSCFPPVFWSGDHVTQRRSAPSRPSTAAALPAP